jgi:hypothetical protein
MRQYDGILWKIKEIEVMTENCTDIPRVLDATDYRLPLMTLLFMKRLNDTFEENAEIYNQFR